MKRKIRVDCTRNKTASKLCKKVRVEVIFAGGAHDLALITIMLSIIIVYYTPSTFCWTILLRHAPSNENTSNERRNLKSSYAEKRFAKHTSHKYLMFPCAIKKKYDKSNWSFAENQLAGDFTFDFKISKKRRRIIGQSISIFGHKENIIKFKFFPYQHKNIIIIALLLDSGHKISFFLAPCVAVFGYWN